MTAVRSIVHIQQIPKQRLQVPSVGAERPAVESLRLHDPLEWYGENARLAPRIHSEGDPGRQEIANIGGALARTVLNK